MITPLDKGSLVHEALEQLPLDVLDRPLADRPKPGEPWTDGRPPTPARDRRGALRPVRGAGAGGPAHLLDPRPPPHPGRPRRHPRRRLRAPRRRSGTAPLFAELGFGFVVDSIDAVEVRLPDGRTLRVRGRIDRVDVAADGTIHVVDYKTGSYHAATSDLLERRPGRRGHQAAAPDLRAGRPGRRAATRPRRCTPSTGSSPPRAASPGAATTSPTRCSSAPSRCSTSSSAASRAACSRRTRRRCPPSSGSPARCATPTGSAPPSCASSGTASATTRRLRAYAELAEPLEEAEA